MVDGKYADYNRNHPRKVLVVNIQTQGDKDISSSACYPVILMGLFRERTSHSLSFQNNRYLKLLF